MADSDLEVTLSVSGNEYEVLSASVHRHYGVEIDTGTVEVTDNEGGPDPATLIGKSAVLTVRRADESAESHYAGVIFEATHAGADGLEPIVRLTVAPRLWRLSKRSDCRIFQQQTVREIVTDVLSRAGIPDADQQWKLNASYEPRTYCAQHRETDWVFVSRLLCEEGISIAVEVVDGIDVVCLSDSNLGAVEGATTLPYYEEFGADEARDGVERLAVQHQVKSDKVALRDYDFERPDFELKGEAESQDDGAKSLETYVFPARSNKEAVAKHYAQVLLESLQADREVMSGGTQALHLAPGRTFTVSDHPYAPLNQEYLVLSVQYRFRASRWGADSSGDAQGYTFTAMPTARGPHRPPRKAAARALPGYDSAVVVGPSGSEIHPDEFGRVKAQYPWDRLGDGSDTASCWMRTFQAPLAGGQLTPRVGWEVTTHHIEGDPDMPVIAGRMYTSKAPPPYALPEHKTRMTTQTATSPGGGSVNELRFEDKKGSEEMHMNASHNMGVSAGNNATETVGGCETRTIGANQKLDVSGAMESISSSQAWTVAGSQDINVSSYGVDQNGGAHTHAIGGSRDVKVGGDHRRLVGGGSTLKVGGSQIDLVVGSVTEATTSTMDDTIGAVLVEIAGGGRNVAVSGDRVETVGAVKAVLCSGGRNVNIGGTMTHEVSGAIGIVAKADVNDNSDGALKDIAGGAQVVTATNVSFAAKSLLSVVCGGATLTLTPGSVTLAGAGPIKLDGVCPQSAALIKDN